MDGCPGTCKLTVDINIPFGVESFAVCKHRARGAAHRCGFAHPPRSWRLTRFDGATPNTKKRRPLRTCPGLSRRIYVHARTCVRPVCTADISPALSPLSPLSLSLRMEYVLCKIYTPRKPYASPLSLGYGFSCWIFSQSSLPLSLSLSLSRADVFNTEPRPRSSLALSCRTKLDIKLRLFVIPLQRFLRRLLCRRIIFVLVTRRASAASDRSL